MTLASPLAKPVRGDARVKDYVALLKPRVMALAIFTAIVGWAGAPGSMHPFLSVMSILAIAVGAGGAGALNMWFDADIDGVMHRTKNRPIPAGRIDARQALAFGMILSVGSSIFLGLVANWVAGILLMGTIGFYIGVYTMGLKRTTAQNIVIGGAAGALPPVVGWASVTGSVSLEAVVLFLIIFLWTPPHFWALALYHSDDYKRAKVPILPLVSGDKSTRRQIFFYSCLLTVATSALWPLEYCNASTFLLLSLNNGVFLYKAWQVLRGNSNNVKPSQKLFRFSIVYLFALFTLLLLDPYHGLLL